MSWRSTLSKSVRELRIHLDGKSSSGSATRNWVLNNYDTVKRLNPSLPVLIREAPSIAPVVWAQYDFGAERSFDMSGLSESEIDQRIKLLASYGASFPQRAERVSTVVDQDVINADQANRRDWTFRVDMP